MPDYLLQLLRRTTRALRRADSVASMGDEAGREAVDAAMHGGGDGNGGNSGNSGSGSGRGGAGG
jgi:hypothetical protein